MTVGSLNMTDEDTTRGKEASSRGKLISEIFLGENLSMTMAALPKYHSTKHGQNERVIRKQDTIVDGLTDDSSFSTMMNDYAPSVDTDMLYSESLPDIRRKASCVTIATDQLSIDLLELMRKNSGRVNLLQGIENGTVLIDTIRIHYSSCTLLEKNIALLWSAFMKQTNFVEALLSCGADINYCEPDEGFSALHLSAFSGCVSTVKYLISEGADVNYALRNYTPLHSAAFGNSAVTAQILIDNGASTDIVSNTSDGASSVMQSAIKSNSVSCVRLLTKYCSDINLIERNGAAPIHIAADLGHYQCLQVLLDTTGIDVNVKTRNENNTALHLAADSGNSECISILLSKNADPNAINSRGKTALHLASTAQRLQCVIALLKSGRCDPNIVDDELKTSLHYAVGCVHREDLAFDITEALISGETNLNLKDKSEYTPLHVAALNERPQCVETLLFHGADITAKDKKGVTALAIIVRKTPASLEMFYNNLDKAVSIQHPVDSSQDLELNLDFSSILRRKKGEVDMLNSFVEEGQKQILKHPLCEAFLYLKWEKIRKFYLARIFFYFLFVCLFTGHGLIAKDYVKHSPDTYVTIANRSSCNESALKIETVPSIGEENKNVALVKEGLIEKDYVKHSIDTFKIVDRSWCNESAIKIQQVPSIGEENKNKGLLHVSLVISEWYILMVFTAAEILRKLVALAGYKSWRQYFLHFENLVEWFVIGSVFAVSNFHTGQTYLWQKHIFAFAIICAWYILMVQIGQLPVFGSYVAMYMKVLEEFAKLGLAYICLLVGFTVSFCVLFPSTPEFENPLIGIINVLTMMTGEVGIKFIINTDGSEVLKYSSHIIFVVFVLLVTIVLMNLLVGIAVYDIQGLKTTAKLSKLVRQTKLIYNMERVDEAIWFFNRYLPKYVLEFVSFSALRFIRITPSDRCVILKLKPLNTKETRLPQKILESAFELSKTHCFTGHTLSSVVSDVVTTAHNEHSSTSSYWSNNSIVRKFGRQKSEVECLQAEVEEGAIVLERLRKEMREENRELKEMLENNRAMLSNISTVVQSLVTALSSKK